MADRLRIRLELAKNKGVPTSEISDDEVEAEAQRQDQAGLGTQPVAAAAQPTTQAPAVPKKATAQETVQEAVASTAAPKSPDDAVKNVDKVIEANKSLKERADEFLKILPSAEVSKKEREQVSSKYATESAKIQEEIAKAKKAYQAGEDRLANAELIDTLGKGLVQLMAGWYGMETGRDAVTGVDFKPKDWSSNFALLQKKYEQQIDELESKTTRLDKAEEREMSDLERAKYLSAQRGETAARLAIGAKEQEDAEKRGEAKAAEKIKKAEEDAEKVRNKLITKANAEVGALRQVASSGKTKEIKEAEKRVAASLRAAGIPAEEVDSALKEYKPGGMFTKADFSPLENLIALPETVQPKAQPQGAVLPEADRQALEWLKANPNHPKSNEVRNTLKAKGIQVQ